MEEERIDDDEKFVITPPSLLYKTLKDYGVDPGEWYPVIWGHIYEDFMDGLVRAGYVMKEDE